jgi:hypothetical protein
LPWSLFTFKIQNDTNTGVEEYYKNNNNNNNDNNNGRGGVEQFLSSSSSDFGEGATKAVKTNE